MAIDIPSLIEKASSDRISILKMDIEGAEIPVFREDVSSWISKVDAIAIEIHEDTSFGPARPVFDKAIAGQNFDVSTAYELLICRRPVGQSSPAATS